MLKRGHNEPREFQIREAKTNSPAGRQDGGVGVRSGADRRKRRMPSREHSASAARFRGVFVRASFDKAQRESLLEFIDKARESDSIETICRHLQIHPRSYHRWKGGNMRSSHGGGGGLNKIRPLEEKRVLALVKKHPEWHCRRIAYNLEKGVKVFIGKTKVAEIMKAHGLNHPFERKPFKHVIIPADMLLHEPWRKNLL